MTQVRFADAHETAHPVGGDRKVRIGPQRVIRIRIASITDWREACIDERSRPVVHEVEIPLVSRGDCGSVQPHASSYLPPKPLTSLE